MRATLAIARLTCADGLRQPLTWLSAVVAVALLCLCVIFGMFNFQAEDRMRLLITAGVAVNLLAGLFIGVVSGASVVHDELASRTALTLFAKPMSRASFVLGKALGVWAVVAVVSLGLMALHYAALVVVDQYGFDFLEGGGGHSHQGDGHGHGQEHVYKVDWIPWGRMAAAHVLATLNAVVMTAVACSIALRFSLVPTVLTCFALFVLAHLAAGSGHATTGASILPALALFNVDEALQFQDMPLTIGHFILCLTYGGLYAAGSVLLGLAVFNQQDIP